jgi:Uma2 family endonuclease
VPDLAVEVSSPSTRGVDRLKKRALYERFGVPEYWIVDLDADVIEAYVLADGRYGEPPRRFSSGDVVTSAVIDGFSRPFDELVPA